VASDATHKKVDANIAPTPAQVDAAWQRINDDLLAMTVIARILHIEADVAALRAQHQLDALENHHPDGHTRLLALARYQAQSTVINAIVGMLSRVAQQARASKAPAGPRSEPASPFLPGTIDVRKADTAALDPSTAVFV
jgi:hypothetical protein